MKRIFDLIVTCALLIPALIVGAVIAAAVAADSPGAPVFFSQIRVGKGGRRFRLWKFRSMPRNAETALERRLREHPESLAEWDRSHKLKNDPRVTRLGRVLRRSSLDELPQLWNVLRGEMSLVGPRPIVEAEIPKYGDAFAIYAQVRPGLTGLWQVSGRSNTSYPARVALDAAYVRRHWVRTDFVVLLKTIPAVIRGHGAY